MKCEECGKEKIGNYKDLCRICYDIAWRNKNKQKIKNYMNIYYKKNKIKLKIDSNKYYHETKHKYLERERLYQLNREHNDVNYKLRHYLSTRIRLAVKNKGTKKSKSSIKLLGCTIQKCREHLEKQFKEGMMWNNHGEWHIDHIKPCASFDLTKEEEQLKCFHYTNLQPLWAEENIRKSDNIY